MARQPLVFVELGEDIAVRIDLIVSMHEYRYDNGEDIRTVIFVFGRRDPVTVRMSMSEVMERMRAAMALANG